MDEGKSEEEAAKVVVTKLEDNGLPLPDSYQTRDDHVPRSDWKRLQEWRRKCSSGRRGEWAKTMAREWVDFYVAGPNESVDENIDKEFKGLTSKRSHISL